MRLRRFDCAVVHIRRRDFADNLGQVVYTHVHTSLERRSAETFVFVLKSSVPEILCGSVAAVVRTLDLRSIGRAFESWPVRYRVQSWGIC